MMAALRAGSLRRMGESTERSVLAQLPGPDGDPAHGAGALPQRMGIVLTEATAERVVGNTQRVGLLHGGASCVLAESLGSVGATIHAMRSFGGYALGVEISATHHKAARDGLVTGVATAIHLGGSVATYEIVITDES